MITDYSSARDELFSQLMTAKDSINTLLGYQTSIVFQGIEEQNKQPTNKLWLRVSQQTVLEPQATLTGNDLKRRYTSSGLIFIQVFIPKIPPENYAIGLQVAQLIKLAYRGKSTSSCIWFRNVSIRELPPEDAWFRINVVAEYQYDEIG